MIDNDLERRTADCIELIDAWRMFLDLVNRAMTPPKTITHQLEQQFLNTKARIAMLHDSFMDSLKHDRNTGQNMLEIVNRAITLKLLDKTSEAERKKLEIEWHECFLLLNETVTSLNEERARLAEINELAHNIKKLYHRIIVNLKATIHSFYFKFLVAVIVIGGALGAFAMTEADNWVRTQRWGKGVATSYMDFMRGIGFNMSYLEFKAFTSQILLQADKVGGGITKITRDPERSGQKFKKDTTIDELIRRMGMSNVSGLKENWNNARNFEVYRYDKRGRRGEGDEWAYLYLFFFEDGVEAAKVTSQFTLNSAGIPNTITYYPKANVLAVIQASPQSQGLEEAIKENVLDKIKPVAK